MLNTALEELSDKIFLKKLNMKFKGEEGCDDGGLTLELFSEIFKQVPLFNNSTFKYNSAVISKEQCVFLGQLVAYTSILGHPGP